jgi:hypothetical protein
LQWAAGGGAQRPLLRGNEPKQRGARCARARRVASIPTGIYR